ncbi:MAG: aminotransferase class V-fold PLP-dependent enzyme [Sciscionella sp.]
MREVFGATFDVPDGYLNTASIGVPPRAAADAVTTAVAEWAAGAAGPPDFDAYVAAARAGFAWFVGVEPADVAIGASVSQLVGLVAASLPDGASVLVADGDFTSVSFPFAAQGNRGVAVHEVPLDDVASTVGGHDLVAVSVVQSADGRVLDLDTLREAAEAAGTRVLLDVTQAAGWLPMRLDWVDYVVGGCYKWLLAPRGAAWLAVRPEALHTVVAHAANWYAGEDPWDTPYGLPLRLAGGARGLDLSPVWLAQVGAAATLPWLRGLHSDGVRAHCVSLADGLMAGLGLPPAGSAIVAIDVPGAAATLAEAGVRASVRAGRTRLSFHLYNTVEDVAMVLDALQRCGR